LNKLSRYSVQDAPPRKRFPNQRTKLQRKHNFNSQVSKQKQSRLALTGEPMQ